MGAWILFSHLYSSVWQKTPAGHKESTAEEEPLLSQTPIVSVHLTPMAHVIWVHVSCLPSCSQGFASPDVAVTSRLEGRLRGSQFLLFF